MGQCFLILFSLLTQVLVYDGGMFLLPVGFLLILRNSKSCKPQNKPLKIPPRLGLIHFPQNWLVWLFPVLFNNLTAVFWWNTPLCMNKSNKFLSCISETFLLLNTFSTKTFRWTGENVSIKRLHVYTFLEKFMKRTVILYLAALWLSALYSFEMWLDE